MSNVGRNQPCPCGSGKKYKRCHGLNQPTARRNEVTKIGPRWIQSNAERLLELALDHVSAKGQTPGAGRDDLLAIYEWLTLPDAETLNLSGGQLEELEEQELGGDAEVEVNSAQLSSDTSSEEGREVELSPALREVDLPAVDRRERRIFGQLKRSLSQSTFEPLEVVEVLRGSGLKLRGVCTGRSLQINQPQDAALLEPMEWIYGRVVVFERRAYLLSGWEKLPFRKRKALRAAIEERLGFAGDVELNTLRASAPELLVLCRAHQSSEPERSGL